MAKTTKTPARKPAAAKAKAATDNRRITIPPAVDDDLGNVEALDHFGATLASGPHQQRVQHHAPRAVHGVDPVTRRDRSVQHC